MLEEHTFAYSDVMPSWFANAIQKLLSVGAFQFQVVATDATHIQIPAGAGDQAAAIAIAGLWRWMEATVGPIAHPGGGAGTYPVFVTCKNDSIVSTPQPYTDATDRTFGVQIKGPGQTPTIVAGTVDQYRHVADLAWDGLKITKVQQIVAVTPTHAYRHATGGADALTPTDIGAATATDVHAVESAALQAGVSNGGDCTVTAPAGGPNYPVSGTTFNLGPFGVAAAASPVWVKDSTGILVPVTPATATPIYTFGRPGANQYRATGLEVDTNGVLAFTNATADQSTAAAALAAVPATTSGRLRLADVVLYYDGVSSIQIPVIRDRRPWARGAYASLVGSGGGDYATASTVPVAVDTVRLQVRLEISARAGAVVEITFSGTAWNAGAGSPFPQTRLGVSVDGGAISAPGEQYVQSSAAIPFAVHTVVGLAAGSHLFTAVFSTDTGGGGRIYNTLSLPALVVEEKVRPAGNNGVI